MMKTLLTKAGLAAGVATLAAAVAAPAFAGQCPADQVRANALAGAPTAPKTVTDNVLGAIDLGKEIGVEGRQLRTRRLVVQPGGIVPLHSHAGRPALIIVVSGEINEHRSTCAVPILHKAGELAREDDGISHYWTNDSDAPAVLLSSDVYHDGQSEMRE
jgi:quercetin dioxygenase-like cupin family protein